MKTTARSPVPGQQISVEEQHQLAVDGLLPSKVMRPTSPEMVLEDLKACVAAGVSAVIHGGGTQLGLGAPPGRYDVALSTIGLAKLLEHEPADLTCRVEAGMRFADLQARLGEHGQRLPLDPPHPSRATVGGTVAANASGLSRARFGGVRDWVIGIAVAYPNGKIARAGGKVVKNVAGYDLMKLHTGALGTLGVIVEVNFKVQTLPESEATLFGHFEQKDQALAAGQELARRYLAPAAMVLVDGDVLRECGLTADWAWTLALRLEGYRREMELARSQAAGSVREHAGHVEGQEAPVQFWDTVRDWTAPQDGQVLLYGTTSLAGLSRLLDAVGTEGRVMAEPGAAALHVRTAPASAGGLLERMRRAASPDGQVVVRAASPDLKAELDVWGPPPPGFPLMRELKRTLDPKATLNPGRFVGGL